MEFMGNIISEYQEIEKFIDSGKDSVQVELITYGTGGFLTVLCCEP